MFAYEDFWDFFSSELLTCCNCLPITKYGFYCLSSLEKRADDWDAYAGATDNERRFFTRNYEFDFFSTAYCFITEVNFGAMACQLLI